MSCLLVPMELWSWWPPPPRPHCVEAEKSFSKYFCSNLCDCYCDYCFRWFCWDFLFSKTSIFWALGSILEVVWPCKRDGEMAFIFWAKETRTIGWPASGLAALYSLFSFWDDWTLYSDDSLSVLFYMLFSQFSFEFYLKLSMNLWLTAPTVLQSVLSDLSSAIWDLCDIVPFSDMSAFLMLVLKFIILC